jgi:lactate dehydrogenase-like 2-hydroxyacid dehydrogenase
MAPIFVTRRLPGDALQRLRAVHEVETWPERLPPAPDVLRAHARDKEGLLTMLSDPIDGPLMDACPDLRVISNYAVGSDNIDLQAAAQRGIAVGVTSGVLTDATADLAFACILAAARRFPEAAAAVRSGAWKTWEPDWMLGHDVHGATLGIVGYGRIGRAVAKRATGFDMKIVHTGDASLDEVLARSDAVTLHVPLTAQTRHLIDAAALRRMKPTAVLVNTARGGVVDQDALADALRERRIAGAALDVTDPEPLPPDHPLLSIPNLLVLPHVGSATHPTRERMADVAVDNLLAGLAGRPLPHPAG